MAKFRRRKGEGVRQGYPEGVQRLAAEIVGAKRMSCVALAARTGLNGNTLKRYFGLHEKALRAWAVERQGPRPAQRPAPSGTFTPVRVVAEPAGGAQGGIALVAPGGYRIEGLSCEQAAAVLGRIQESARGPR